jgi:hypothetical protein
MGLRLMSHLMGLLLAGQVGALPTLLQHAA